MDANRTRGAQAHHWRGRSELQVTERTRIRNHPERAAPGETAAILAAGMVAHVGFIDGGLPYVI